MSNPMRTFITDDGRKFLLPGDRGTRLDNDDDFDYHCDCHKMMGNDFWFLPAEACLRADKKCTNPKPYRTK